MVRLSDLPPEYADSLRKLPLPLFESTPWVEGPDLKTARVAIISTAGLHRASDPKFAGGSGDYRLLPADLDYGELTMSHVSLNFDRSGFQQDVGVVLPLENLKQMAADGEIGSVARWHYSFMGATDPTRMVETAPQVAKLLKEDGVDAAILVPVWPNCTRAVGGLSHYIEAEGVATAGISLVREHTEQIKPPRALWVPFELGRPFGPPGHAEFQKDVLRALLSLFARGSGPVLEDYPHDSPVTEEMDAAWSCALPLPPLDLTATPAEALTQSLLQEVGNLAPWYAESIRRRGRTTFGLSGLSADRMDEIAGFLARMAAGEDPEPPQGLADPLPGAIRYMVDDVKAYYMEAANEQPGAPPPGGVRMWTWFFHETRMGGVLYDLRDRFAAELAARTEANGGQPPPGPPPPNMISARFAQRPQK